LPKEKATCSLAALLLAFGCLALLEINGRCETRGVYALGCSDSPHAYSIISSLLGCVKWHMWGINKDGEKKFSDTGKHRLRGIQESKSEAYISTPQ